MNLIKIFNNYKNTPKKRLLYAIEGGDFLGEFFLYFEKTNRDYLFLSLPGMFVRKVPIEAFERGINNKILVPYKKLPLNVFKICDEQFKHSKKTPSLFTNDTRKRSIKHAINSVDNIV